MKTKWIFILAIALVCGCTPAEDNAVRLIKGEFTLHASCGEKGTKTVLRQDGSILWNPSDRINVYYGDKAGVFTSTNTEAAATAEFTGSLGSFALDGTTDFMASYPYSAQTILYGDALYINLPSEQTAVEGTFADELFISVAKSKDCNLHFHNVCGGVAFSLKRDDIKKVVFRGNNGESLAGKLAVVFASDGIPQVASVSAESTSVTLVPADGTFKAGAFYYIVLVPQTLKQGYTMELYTDELVDKISFDTEVTVERSVWGVLKDLGQEPQPEIEAIDMGLSVKWGSFNIGASKPEDYGDYFAWGETEPKSDYGWSTYIWCSGSVNKLIKYNDSSSCGPIVDNKDTLEMEDDAANALLKGNWRMPTYAEINELISSDNCRTEWSTINGVGGMKITSKKTGNSIFLPGAGYRYGKDITNTGYYGYYWSSSLHKGSPIDARAMDFDTHGINAVVSNRDVGYQVRPVTDEGLRVAVTGISLDLSSITLKVNETATLSAIVEPSNATDKTVTWSTSDASVATVKDGVVTAVAPGTATINVTTTDGGYKATCTVTVNAATVSVSSVSLDKTSLEMTEGETQALTATVNPADATNQTVSWSSSNTSVATVSSLGVVTAVALGTATITVTTTDGGYTATCAVTVTQSGAGTENGHMWIDLGLPSGLKWATCNVGANAPEEYGGYFAWGEVEPYYTEGHSQDTPCFSWRAGCQYGYNWASYRWCAGISLTTLTKYIPSKYYDCDIDNKDTLDLQDDAARTTWGGTWRMPTKPEMDELFNNCTSKWTTKNGVYGRQFTSKQNGNSIFLPAAGHRAGEGLQDAGTGIYGYEGYYWSSSLHSRISRAWGFHFDSDDVYDNTADDRCDGWSVRPVTDGSEQVAVTIVTLDKTSLSMRFNETITISAMIKPSNATNKNVIWSTSSAAIATVQDGVVTAVSTGTATITATTVDGSHTATCTVIVAEGIQNGHAWVDLGLPSGLKWATCNVGANTPEDYGHYFAWGETVSKTNYDWDTYRWCQGTKETQTKYNKKKIYGPVVDNKTTLELEDDAANANWGGNWRTPTIDEFKELINYCSIELATQNGVKGKLFTSKNNGISIFLPAAGGWDGTSLEDAGTYGYYFSSSLYPYYPYEAWSLSFSNSGATSTNNYYYRCCGLSVRPVTE